jgi:hypothetical protein
MVLWMPLFGEFCLLQLGFEGNLGATHGDYWTSSTFVPNPAYK